MHKRLPYLIAAVLFLPLAAHSTLSLSTRMLADDFCFTYTFSANGVWGALDYYYRNWSAYYAAIIGQGVVGMTGFTRYLPTFTIFGLLLASWWTGYQLAAVIGIAQRRLAAFIAAIALVSAVLMGTPNVYQSIYWTSGNITYAVPMVILIFHLGALLFALRRSNQVSPAYLALFAGLAMLSGGFSPFYGVLQLMVFLMSGTAAWRYRQKTARAYLAISFGFGLISLLILLAAPGNAIRTAVLFESNQPLSLLELVGQTLFASLTYFPLFFGIMSPFALMATLIVFVWIGNYFHPKEQPILRYSSRHSAAIAFVVTWLLVAAGFFTGLYSAGALPPGRAYVILQMALSVMVAVWGYLMGVSLHTVRHPSRLWGRLAWTILAVGLCIGPVRAAVETLSLMPDFQTFAAEWDARDAVLRSASQRGIVPGDLTPFTVDLADYMQVESMDDNPNNPCVRDYYDFQERRITFDSSQ